MDLDTIAKLKKTLSDQVWKLMTEFEKTTGQTIDSVSLVRDDTKPCSAVKIRVIVGVI